MSAEVWGLLHDGIIERIESNAPQSLSLTVSIDYLRKMFSGDGHGFVITLDGVSQFEYEEYDNQTRWKNIADIETRSPEILFARAEENGIVVECAEGVLRMKYEQYHIRLDNGQLVSLEALDMAAQKYWEEFGKKKGKKP